MKYEDDGDAMTVTLSMQIARRWWWRMCARCDAMRRCDAKWFSALQCPCGCDSLVLVLNCVAASSSSSSSRSASCVVLSGQSSKLLTSNCRTLSQHGETTTTKTRRKTQLVHALLKDADRTCSVRRQHRNLGVVLARSTRHSLTHTHAHTNTHTHTQTIKLMNMGRTQTWDKYAVGI